MKTTANTSAVIDPVCGMTVDPLNAAGSHEHEGRSYFFCSRTCLEQFKADPEKYVPSAGPMQNDSASNLEIDPVCKMKVSPATAAARHEHNGQTYYFCSARCAEKFKANPSAYVAWEPESGKVESASDIIYTCPMHREVRQKGPGSCPKCGMALEPEIAVEEEGPNTELIDMTRRFWVAVVLSIPVLALGMLETQRWLQFGLATPAVVWAGWPLFVRGWASLATCQLFDQCRVTAQRSDMLSGGAAVLPRHLPR
jgi:Cu+-exporting ATPase